MKEINEFKNEYRFLSNFYHSKVNYEGFDYPTVEHAYQASKSTDINHIMGVLNTDNPVQAKRLGRTCRLKPDFDELKYDIMKFLVSKKFKSHSDLRYKLLMTKDSILVEGNTWGDTYWGVCNGVGQNNLGKILMEIRDEIRKEFLVEIWTDGACSGNPGRGGLGVILSYDGNVKEFYRGYQHTTNNRMELRAILLALESIKSKSYHFKLHSDSKYCIDLLEKGLNGTFNYSLVKKNADLWVEVGKLIEGLSLELEHVYGHSGIIKNERADELAKRGKGSNNLLVDEGFIND